MILYSTADPCNKVSFKEALVNAFPADKGLYVPLVLPVLDLALLAKMPSMEFAEIAFSVATALLGDEYSADELWDICYSAFNFDVNLHQLHASDYVLELFHGPTLAFKDFGARFMAKCLQAAVLAAGSGIGPGKPTVVLTATSGDTGGAVASGFKGVAGVKVVILYPEGRISASQRRQLSTPGENIYTLALEGSFDDCQRIVKEAFLDPELSRRFQLCSANSINIGRLIPQSFYYFFAWSRLPEAERGRVVLSVPSGNFGNLTAGVMAWKMGLPVKQFIAACNENDTIPRFLESGVYDARASLETLSSAMDVGNPSNFPRLLHLFGDDIFALREMITGYRVSDIDTKLAVDHVLSRDHYQVDPHTGVGLCALERYRMSFNSDDPGIVLSTAHAAKFWPDHFGSDADQPTRSVLPPELASLTGMSERIFKIAANLEAVRGFFEAEF